MKLTGGDILIQLESKQTDGHAHIFNANLPMSAARRYTPLADALLKDYLSLLKAHNISSAILIQPSFLGNDNSYMLEALRKLKSISSITMLGVAVIQPNTSKTDILELHKQGIIGIRLNFVGNKQPFIFKDWESALKIVDQFGMHVEVHCEGGRLPIILHQLTKKCDTIVVDHFGLPSSVNCCVGQQAIIELSTKHKIFVKTSAPYRVHPQLSSQDAAKKVLPMFQRLAERLGNQRLLWGSDWPWTHFENKHSYTDCLNWLDYWISNTKI